MDLTVATYNLGPGSRKAADLSAIAAQGAHAIGLQEAGDQRREIRAFTDRAGWRTLQTSAEPGMAAVCWVLDTRVVTNIRSRMVLAVPRRWVGPKGAGPEYSKPKYIAVADCEVGGQPVHFLDTHLIPSWTRTKAYLGEKEWRARRNHVRDHVAAIVKTAANLDGLVILTADFNGEPDEPLLAPLRAAGFNGWIWTLAGTKGKRAIDQVLVRDGGPGTLVRRRVLDKLTSDHKPVAATVRLEAVEPPAEEDPVGYRYLTNLADVLRDAGLTVVELDGWKTRGRPRSTGGFDPVGVLWHHTGGYDALADAADDLSYARWMALTGRPEDNLPAPLCNLSISREGVVYVIAAGRANHAGKAKASGTVAAGDGNSLYIGVECMNSGKQGWDRSQYDAMVRTGAALAGLLGTSVETQRGHKETSVTGKWDPGLLDMDRFRRDIANYTESEEDDMALDDRLWEKDPDSPTVRDVLRSLHKFRGRTDARLKELLNEPDSEELVDRIADRVAVTVNADAAVVKDAVKEALREGVA